MADTANQAPASGLTPHITIREGRGAEAIAFYQKAFAAEELARHPADDGKRLLHAHLRINGGSLLLNDDFPEYSGSATAVPAATVLHLETDDADAWWQRAIDAGAIVHFPIDNQFWGARYGQVVDPFGHRWSIGGPVKE